MRIFARIAVLVTIILSSTPFANTQQMHLFSQDSNKHPVTNAATAPIKSWPLGHMYQGATSKHYSVTVNGKQIHMINNANSYHHGHFGMGFGQAFVKVQLLEPVLPLPADATIRVSPEKHGIKADVNNNIVSFTLPHDGYYIIKIGTLKEIVLLADPPEINVPDLESNDVHNVLALGASPNVTDAAGTTKAFQSALDKSGKDGKPVVVPPGVYFVKNLVLPSNSQLYLAPAAILRFTGKAADYKVHWFKTSQNRNITWWISTAFKSKNIRIWGRGILDGNGWEASTSGKIGNNILVPISTTDFYVEGITFRNGAGWTVTPIATENVHMENVKVLNRLDMGENDGFDVMHSNNVTITHSIAIALDDPYSTKCWRMGTNIATSWPADAARDQTDVTINDALSWTRCFGLKVGQGVDKNQSNIRFLNSTIYSASIGIGVNHKWGTSNAYNILFENIDIEATPLMLENRSSWEAMFTEGADKLGAGTVRGVTIRNVKVRRPGRTTAQLSGLNSERLIEQVTFENIWMPGMDRAATSLKELNITDVRFAKDIFVNGRAQELVQEKKTQMETHGHKEVQKKLHEAVNMGRGLFHGDSHQK